MGASRFDPKTGSTQPAVGFAQFFFPARVKTCPVLGRLEPFKLVISFRPKKVRSKRPKLVETYWAETDLGRNDYKPTTTGLNPNRSKY